jgi:hypothetical protein
MSFDYWHLRRRIRLQGSDDDLPFSEPPFVVGPILDIPEPVWQSLVATALSCGVADFPMGWSWERPLSRADVLPLRESIDQVTREVDSTRDITVAPDIAENALPDVGVVLAALRAFRRLLDVAAADGRNVETWVE